MREVENYCVGCETCIGYGCRYKDDILVVSCDICGSQEDLYEVGEDDICLDCLMRDYESIFDFLEEYKQEYLDFIGARKINYD